jgi:hypothetical protein
VGIGKDGIFASMDGINWNVVSTLINNSSTPQIGRVIWNGKIWVAVGNGVSFAIAYSLDGIAWTGVSNSKTLFDLSGGAIDVAWNGKVFAAVGANTKGRILALSSEGITWTNSLEGNAYQLTTGDLTAISQGFKINFPKPAKPYSSFILESFQISNTTSTLTGNPVSGSLPAPNKNFTASLACTDSGFVVGGGGESIGILQYSTDFGSTWNNLSNFFGSGFGVFDIAISNNLNRMFIGAANLAYSSTNGGVGTWNATVSSPVVNNPWSVSCGLSGIDAIVWSRTNGLFISFNSGGSWGPGFIGELATPIQHSTAVSKDGSMYFMCQVQKSGGDQTVGTSKLYYVNRSLVVGNRAVTWSNVNIGTCIDNNVARNLLAVNLNGSIVYTGCTAAVRLVGNSTIRKITNLPGTGIFTTITYDSVTTTQICQGLACSSDGNTVVIVAGNSFTRSTNYYISLNAGSTWTKYSLPTTSGVAVMNCTCSPDGKNVYISANVTNAQQSYGEYFIRIGYKGAIATFTTYTYTQSGLESTSVYTTTLKGTDAAGTITTLYTGSVTPL